MPRITDDLEASSKREFATEESAETTVDDPTPSTSTGAVVQDHKEKHEHGAKWKANEVHTLPPKYVFYQSYLSSSNFFF